MAALLGSIGAYDADKEEWPQYVERLSFFFEANGITGADKKKVSFLTLIGRPAFKLLWSLLHPNKPANKTFDELTQILTDHYKPAPSEIVQRFKFHSRFRKQGESVATYVSELRALAEYCNFGETLQDMLRDRLVCGINDDRIQGRLLSEPKLKYDKAVELATTLETAAHNLKELTAGRLGNRQDREGLEKPESVHRIQDKDRSKEIVAACYRCGNPDHKADKCKFRDATCHLCGKKGHLKKVYRSKKSMPKKKKPAPPQPVRRVQEDEETEDEYPLYHLHSASPDQPIEISLNVGGCTLSMELDTGAALSLVSEMLFKARPDSFRIHSNTLLLLRGRHTCAGKC